MIEDRLESILQEIPPAVKLVAVSKYHPLEDIQRAFLAGQTRFGENRPQEFSSKAIQLPPEIEWHFIGHLQTNKLKLVLPYASLVESVDSDHLLDAIQLWCEKNDRVVNVLLEVHIGAEDTKDGLTPDEVLDIIRRYSVRQWPNVRICGLMGMASHTDDEERIREDFAGIKALFDRIKDENPGMTEFKELSIGMSDDWKIAVEYGATIVRIGTSIFGERNTGI